MLQAGTEKIPKLHCHSRNLKRKKSSFISVKKNTKLLIVTGLPGVTTWFTWVPRYPLNLWNIRLRAHSNMYFGLCLFLLHTGRASTHSILSKPPMGCTLGHIATSYIRVKACLCFSWHFDVFEEYRTIILFWEGRGEYTAMMCLLRRKF